MYKIVTAPNQILSNPTKPVVIIDDRIKQICREMVETLKKLDNPKGVGLAANQVGIPLSIFAFRHKKQIRIMINPKLLSHSQKETYDAKGKTAMLEGCLSVPNYYGLVKRFERVKVGFLDLEGKSRVEEFSPPEAIIIQHEMGHLEGHLFVEKLLEQKGKLYKIDNTDKDRSLVEVSI